MRISVVIPAHNASATIRETLDSVLAQTLPPDEILVMDDGGTDNTAAVVAGYAPRVALMRQSNQGVAAARNALCAQSKGDLVAFLDHDDIWHPRYLETQSGMFQKYPEAQAFFTGHTNFFGFGAYRPPFDTHFSGVQARLIAPLDFLEQYHKATGCFASMSYCCVPRSTLSRLGPEIFKFDGADDYYFCTCLPLLGPVVYANVPLVAYRITEQGFSNDWLKMIERSVSVFEALLKRYQLETDARFLAVFRKHFASRRRQYGRLLMAASRASQGRCQFWQAMRNSLAPSSVAKSLAWLLASYLPQPFQPKWPPLRRQWNAKAVAELPD